jgi:hypothetical protein
MTLGRSVCGELNGEDTIKCIPQRRVSGVESSLGTYFSLEKDAPVNAEDSLSAMSSSKIRVDDADQRCRPHSHSTSHPHQ